MSGGNVNYRGLQNAYMCHSKTLESVSVSASETAINFQKITVCICNPNKAPHYRPGYRHPVINYRPGYRRPEWASGIRVGFQQ